MVIATVGSWPNNPASIVGKVIKAPKSAEGALLNQNAVILRVKSKGKTNQLFLFYRLKTKDFSEYIVSGAQGSANQASITLKDIFGFRFGLPPIDEQEAIAKILSDLDSKIELNRQMNVTFEKIGQALFKRWFIDFEFPNEKGKPYKSSGGEMVGSELGRIPKGWQVKKAGEVIDIFGGTTPSTKEPEYWQGGNIYWATPKDLSELDSLHSTAKCNMYGLPIHEPKKGVKLGDTFV